MTTKKWYDDLTVEDLKAIAAGWSNVQWQQLAFYALHGCATAMAKTTDPDLRAQAHDVHEQMLGLLWNLRDRNNCAQVEVE
jgi:hypothetical protein